MTRSVSCVPFLLVGLLVSAAIPAQADFHDGFATVLRIYGAPDRGVHLEALVLAPEESFDHYFFRVVPAEPDAVSLGYVQVREVGSSDRLCEGSVASVVGVHQNEPCDGLRIGPAYEVTWSLSDPDDRLVLYGHPTL